MIRICFFARPPVLSAARVSDTASGAREIRKWGHSVGWNWSCAHGDFSWCCTLRCSMERVLWDAPIGRRTAIHLMGRVVSFLRRAATTSLRGHPSGHRPSRIPPNPRPPVLARRVEGAAPLGLLGRGVWVWNADSQGLKDSRKVAAGVSTLSAALGMQDQVAFGLSRCQAGKSWLIQKSQ